MNGHEPEGDPELDPEQERRIQHLLADLGSRAPDAEPLPPDVAARLEETLAGLVAEREADQVTFEHVATGEVVPLRPRWMPRLAAGAAAVIVLGLGGFAAVNLTGGSTGTSADSASAGGSAAQGEAQAPAEDRAGSTGATQDSPEKSAAGGSSNLSTQAPALSRATFARDAAALVRRTPAMRAPARVSGQDDATSSPSSPPSPQSLAQACSGPRVSDGSSTTRITLDGSPAVLVVHPASSGERLVEAFSCDGGRRLASTTVAP